jgi:hypothetical protein
MEKNTKKRINKKNLTLILLRLRMRREKKIKKKEKRETLINQKKR